MGSPVSISELKLSSALPLQCVQVACNLCCNEHKFCDKTCDSARSYGISYCTHRITLESGGATTPLVEDLGEGERLSARLNA